MPMPQESQADLEEHSPRQILGLPSYLCLFISFSPPVGSCQPITETGSQRHAYLGSVCIILSPQTAL